MKQQMHLIGWLATGPISYHQGGWRYPTAEHGFFDAARIADWAATLERAKFDAVFFADGAEFDQDSAKNGQVQMLDLVPVAAVIAHETSHIGVGITQNTSVNDGFNLARQLGTLDTMSSGRLAWNVVTGQSPHEAAKYGRELPARDVRYARAHEVLTACKGLWASTPAESILLDRTTGRAIATEHLRSYSFEGEHVRVVGPLPVAQSPQGRPVILQAGASPAGRKLAAEHADVVFIMSKTAEQLRASAALIREDAEAAGRAGEVLVVPAVTVIVAPTTEMAEQQWAMLNELVDVDRAIDAAASLTGLNLRDYDLNSPVADMPTPEHGSVGLIKLFRESAEAENLTIAEAAKAMTNSGIPLLLGNPEEVAQQLIELHADTTADGFMIHCPIVPAGFQDFAEMVVPILQEQGLFRTEYEATTLRGNLFGAEHASGFIR